MIVGVSHIAVNCPMIARRQLALCGVVSFAHGHDKRCVRKPLGEGSE
jgi:hypothetical protein